MGRKPLYPHVPGGRRPEFGPQFSRFRDNVKRSLNSRGEFDPGLITARAVEEVLDGYDSEENALLDASILENTGGRRYSGEGYEIGPELIRETVQVAEKKGYYAPVNRKKVDEVLQAKALVAKVASTDAHPAYKRYIELWNRLNWPEQLAVERRFPEKLYDILRMPYGQRENLAERFLK